MMIKIFNFLVLIFLSGSVCAESMCDRVRGSQSYSPLNTKDGVICFVREPVLDHKTGAPSGLNAISLYYSNGRDAPIKVDGGGLLYDETPGEIVDAFAMLIGDDFRERIFVIHYFEVRDSLVEPNSSGRFYSVSVYYSVGGVLHEDARATEWFGVGYSWLSDGREVVYKFPYQSRKDVQRVVNSPFAQLMVDAGGIQVRLKSKSYLFDEPDIGGRTKKYLIKGDRAVLERVTAGWCEIGYFGRAKPLHMWLMCDALYVDPQDRSEGLLRSATRENA